jgi:hypothetical protein
MATVIRCEDIEMIRVDSTRSEGRVDGTKTLMLRTTSGERVLVEFSKEQLEYMLSRLA